MYKAPINDYQRAVENFKRELLARALTAHGGNRSRTAQTLGLQRTYLLRLIRQLGLAERIPGPRGHHSAAGVGK
jgi:DNA-binding NtrC family response regulator